MTTSLLGRRVRLPSGHPGVVVAVWAVGPVLMVAYEATGLREPTVFEAPVGELILCPDGRPWPADKETT